MAKLIQCKTCSKEIASNSKNCPSCGAKNKKPFYKKIWVWIVVILIFGAIGSGGSDETEVTAAIEPEVTQNQQTEVVVESVPTEYKSALKKAILYSDTMSMSKAGLYDQLTSEYGEQFSQEAAQYAIDNVVADWNENALKKAITYQETMSMSPNAIYDQLISEYGEQFTAEEAQYAVDNLK